MFILFFFSLTSVVDKVLIETLKEAVVGCKVTVPSTTGREGAAGTEAMGRVRVSVELSPIPFLAFNK